MRLSRGDGGVTTNGLKLGAAGCDVAGYVVTVSGHAEAVVKYTAASGAFVLDPAATSSMDTGSGTRAIISKVNPGGAPITFLGTKTGCKLEMVKRAPIESGTFPSIADTVAYAATTSLVQ